MSSYLNIFDFTVLQLILYIILWAIIGGLPGFYMFYSRNHNPRTGVRLGMITGIGLGVMFAGMDSFQPEEIFNNTLFLWLWAAVMSFFIPRGTHTQSASLRQNVADLAYGLLLPTFLIVMAIIVVPMIWNVLFAFRPITLRNLQRVELLSLDSLSLDNFERVLTTRRGRFWYLLRISLFYTFVGSLLAILLGFVAALIVKDKFFGRGVYRGILLFPYIAPVVAVALIWQQMLNARLGFFNELIADAGGTRTDFLTTPGWALTAVILFQAWRYFPFAFLFILARLQAIPDELYEAAQVDGAVPSQRLLYVTLPQLRSVFGTLFLLRFIWTFNKFEDIFLLNGGAANTEVLPVQIYNWLFARKNIGASSAVALIMAAVLFLLVGIYFKWFLVEEE